MTVCPGYSRVTDPTILSRKHSATVAWSHWFPVCGVHRVRTTQKKRRKEKLSKCFKYTRAISQHIHSLYISMPIQGTTKFSSTKATVLIASSCGIIQLKTKSLKKKKRRVIAFCLIYNPKTRLIKQCLNMWVKMWWKKLDPLRCWRKSKRGRRPGLLS